MHGLFAIAVVVVAIAFTQPPDCEARSLRSVVTATKHLRRVVHHASSRRDRLGREKRQDDCITACGDYFQNQDFQDCNNIVGALFSDDVSRITDSDYKNYCETLSCDSLLNDAFTCISENCNDAGGNLEPVINMATDSCKKHNGDYCIKNWVTNTRDLDDRSKSYANDYRECAQTGVCDGDACTNILKYLSETDGCCYASFKETISSKVGDLIDSSVLEKCGYTDLEQRCT